MSAQPTVGAVDTIALLSPHQLANALGVSSETVYRRAAAGDWPHYRVGPRLRFDLSEVLAALRVAPSTPSPGTMDA
jgi:excisionase family DNA binding protein